MKNLNSLVKKYLEAIFERRASMAKSAKCRRIRSDTTERSTRSKAQPAAEKSDKRLLHQTVNPATPGAARFALGQLCITSGASLEITPQEAADAIRRHANGDWGELDEHDRQMNENALKHDARLLSVYRTKSGRRFYVITEADRSVTTILFPEEY